MAETKKKQKADKIKSKAKQLTLIADDRIILLETKIHPIIITTPPPVFPVAFSTLAFIFTTERKKNIPKLFIYYVIEKKISRDTSKSGLN